MAPHPRNGWRLGPEVLFVATLTLLFVIAQPADQWIFQHFAYPGIYEHGWARMLRLAGYLPLGGLIALALVLQAWGPGLRRTLLESSRRGVLLFWAAARRGAVRRRLRV